MEFSNITIRKRKNVAKTKVIPWHVQKRCMTSLSHNQTLVNEVFRGKLKSLMQNNKQLALALQVSKLKAATKEDAVIEAGKHLEVINFSRLKIIEISDNMRNALASVDETLELLNSYIAAPTESRKPRLENFKIRMEETRMDPISEKEPGPPTSKSRGPTQPRRGRPAKQNGSRRAVVTSKSSKKSNGCSTSSSTSSSKSLSASNIQSNKSANEIKKPNSSDSPVESDITSSDSSGTSNKLEKDAEFSSHQITTSKMPGKNSKRSKSSSLSSSDSSDPSCIQNDTIPKKINSKKRSQSLTSKVTSVISTEDPVRTTTSSEPIQDLVNAISEAFPEDAHPSIDIAIDNCPKPKKQKPGFLKIQHFISPLRNLEEENFCPNQQETENATVVPKLGRLPAETAVAPGIETEHTAACALKELSISAPLDSTASPESCIPTNPESTTEDSLSNMITNNLVTSCTNNLTRLSISTDNLQNNISVPTSVTPVSSCNEVQNVENVFEKKALISCLKKDEPLRPKSNVKFYYENEDIEVLSPNPKNGKKRLLSQHNTNYRNRKSVSSPFEEIRKVSEHTYRVRAEVHHPPNICAPLRQKSSYSPQLLQPVVVLTDILKSKAIGTFTVPVTNIEKEIICLEDDQDPMNDLFFPPHDDLDVNKENDASSTEEQKKKRRRTLIQTYKEPSLNVKMRRI